MRNSRRAVMLALVAVVGVGCKNNDDAAATGSPASASPIPDADAPTGKWQAGFHESHDLLIGTGAQKVEVYPQGKDGRLWLRLDARNLPERSVLRINEATHAVTSSISESFEAPTPVTLGTLPIEAAEDTQRVIEVPATVGLKLENTKELAMKVPSFKVWGSVQDLFKNPAAAIAFADEPAPEGKPDAAVLIDINGFIDAVIGSGEVLQDIDVVVTTKHEPSTRTKPCSGYTSGTITLVMVDSKVVAYDRRTGKVLEEKVFKADERCPEVVLEKNGKANGYADTDVIKKWVEKLLPGAKPATNK